MFLGVHRGTSVISTRGSVHTSWMRRRLELNVIVINSHCLDSCFVDSFAFATDNKALKTLTLEVEELGQKPRCARNGDEISPNHF